MSNRHFKNKEKRALGNIETKTMDNKRQIRHNEMEKIPIVRDTMLFNHVFNLPFFALDTDMRYLW